ncbi:MAG: response regulator [Endomicrobiales bacterium]|jgi:PAS domain S-box-containing protein
MSEQLQVLIIEDSEDDARLLVHRLHSSGLKPLWQRVDEKESLHKALDKQVWDVVLCDYSVPGLDAMASLTTVKQKDSTVPFIIVSGVIVDETAVEMLKAGANDYLKKDRLDQLVPVIQREMRKADFTRACRHAENAALESEKRYREIFEHTADAIFTVDVLSNRSFEYDSFNPACEKVLGIKISEALNQRPDDLFPSPVAATMNADFHRCVQSAKPIRCKEELTLPNGFVIIDMTLIPVKDKDMKIVRIVGVAHDITERTTMEFELSDTRKQLALTAAAVHIGLWDWDLRTHKMYISPEWKRQMGYAESEISNEYSSWEQCIHPDDLPVVLSMMRDSLQSSSQTLVLECRFRHKNGSYRWTMSQWSYLRDSQGTPYRVLGVDMDITVRKQREGNLLQSQKMEAIGKFAGGISHDYSNILTIIMGFTDTALTRWEHKQYDQIRDELREIKKAAQMGASLMTQLQAFCRTQHLRPEKIVFSTLIETMQNMLQRLIGEDIRLVTGLAPDLNPVFADRSQCEQVIMNLMIRAKDVMPKGGTVTITTRNVVLKDTAVPEIPEGYPGECVCISVADTGSEMDKDIIAHVFEPFSSDREPAKGTGFGMAANYGIVRQHNGWIQVSSEPGKGSTFKIFLPAYREKNESVAPVAVSPVTSSTAHGERILFVEDEDVIRMLIARLLRENKYIVFDASSGEDALEIFQKEKGAFDLLFTDSVLPGINGVALAQQILALDFRIKVLITSGYLDDKSQWESIKKAGYHFLKKPCDQKELLAAVRESIVH